VCTSPRAARCTEAGLPAWVRSRTARASHEAWALMPAGTVPARRHAWAHQARAAGWPLDEGASSLGHVPNKGPPALHTTARYTQVSRERVREQRRLLSGGGPQAC
jgi:hypothetical protein